MPQHHRVDGCSLGDCGLVRLLIEEFYHALTVSVERAEDASFAQTSGKIAGYAFKLTVAAQKEY